jgi:hypothetical protein
MKQRKLYYSGRKSEGFWKRIAKLKGARHDAAYNLGVALQNLEGDVLTILELFEEEVKKKKV